MAYPATVLRPRSLLELRDIVFDARTGVHGPLTFRMSGNSLHDQSLTGETLVRLDLMPQRIRVTLDDLIAATPDPLRWHTVEVAGWTPWDAVHRATLRLERPRRWPGAWSTDPDDSPRDRTHPTCSWTRAADTGLEPLPRLLTYIGVSSGRISCAGSLAADGVWRFSAIYGKESDSVVWVDLLRADGAVLRLFGPAGSFADRGRAPSETAVALGQPGPCFASDLAQNDRWFRSVANGFGLTGVILRIKYLLLELDPTLTAADFLLHSPASADVVDPPFNEKERCYAHELEVEREAFGEDRVLIPDYPHSGIATGGDRLGEVGAGLEQQANTWLWPTEDFGEVFDLLTAHRRKMVEALSGQPLSLPRRTAKELVACFALNFTNRSTGVSAIIGNIGFGRPEVGAERFRLWDRGFGWTSTALALKTLPGSARVGERVVYSNYFSPAFGEQGPRANPIPETIQFLGGHAVALGLFKQAPETTQQAFSVPVDATDVATSRALFVRFMHALNAMGRQPKDSSRYIQVQVTDVKFVPSSASPLASTHGMDALMVTTTAENVGNYDLRDDGRRTPLAALEELAREFSSDGVRVHLTKNRYADQTTLRSQYGAAVRAFAEVKSELDPSGVFDSSFWRALLELTPRDPV